MEKPPAGHRLGTAQWRTASLSRGLALHGPRKAAVHQALAARPALPAIPRLPPRRRRQPGILPHPGSARQPALFRAALG